ncbi:hypothetical protein KO465_00865 [Candidatus Micrarchaeota archaeon]|jgi:asparaginyl-tRNA synthetase|nr:hypothetical protein [Candidatus Micrarchaeota archaeon]
MKQFAKPKVAVAKVEAQLLKSAREFFDKHDYTEVVVPHVTRATGACENIDTLFGLNYFGKQGYLTQTGQLYLESLIPDLKNVFCIGPSFRAEPRVDNRHLTEFTLVEIELPCGFNELLDHIEELTTQMVFGVAENCKEELEFLGVQAEKLKGIKNNFQRISYTFAIEKLKEQGFEIGWGDDLKSKHEAKLVELNNNNPVFITHFPKAIKFFNMKENDSDSSIVNSADLILPVSGEAVGSAEREHRHDHMVRRLKESFMLKQLEKRGGSIDDFSWYLNLIKDKSNIPHSGCGIGLNRITQFVTNASDIRDTTTFPLNKETMV